MSQRKFAFSVWPVSALASKVNGNHGPSFVNHRFCTKDRRAAGFINQQ